MDAHPLKPGHFLLLYGSQTGQAQAIAEEIFERSSKHGLQPDMHCMSMFQKKFQLEDERCVVIVTSTTGDGDPPDTAVKFVRRFNRKTLKSDHLAHIKYSVLGLGDSNYSNFCNNAKNVDRRLSELGAQRFHPSVFADEVDGLDVTADPWIDGLFPALQTLVGMCTDADVTTNGHTTDTTNGHTTDTTTDTTDTTTSDTTTSTNSTAINTNTSIPSTLIGRNVPMPDAKGDSTDSSVSESESSQKSKVTVLSESGDSKTELSGEGQQESCEAEDTVEIGRPVLCGEACLRVSTPALADKALTLPAATPAFLSATFLPHDQDLGSKMSSLPWQNGCKAPSAASDITKAKVVSAQRLTADDAVKKTLLLTLSVEGSNLRYRPGDSISVVCTNDDKEVSQLIKRLGLVSKADLPLKLGILQDTKKRRAAVPPHVPEDGASLRYILKHCVDIREPPKKALLRQLVNYTADASEKRRLQELCSKEGGEDYTAFVHTQRVSLVDVLYTFPSCQPPLQTLMEHLPRLQPRPYSICSCDNWRPGHVDIAFNVVSIPPSPCRLYARRGLCTGWLDDVTLPLQQQQQQQQEKHAGNSAQGELAGQVETLSLADVEVQIFARTNQHFRTPEDLSVPLVMIGPGTGVAPYIGFLQERQLRLKKRESAGPVGETWLLFGCRHKEKDFLFRSAIEEFQENGTLTKFLPAFSRDPPQADPGNPSARYVQDNIRSHAPELCCLLQEKEAVVFVCGDAKHMAVDVMAAFQDILAQELGLSAEKAKEEVMKLRIRHRYLEDVWT